MTVTFISLKKICMSLPVSQNDVTKVSIANIFLILRCIKSQLVKEIWVVHMTLRSYKISCGIKGHVDLWGQLQGKCIFFRYRWICQFITPSIIYQITSNFQVWSLKTGLPVVKVLRHQYFKIEISPLFTIRLSSNLLMQNQIDDMHLYLNMICDIINLVFNKMEETFQSNTLDWSSLVLFYFSLPPTCVSRFLPYFSTNLAEIWHVDSPWWDEQTEYFCKSIGPGVGTRRGPKVLLCFIIGKTLCTVRRDKKFT